MSELVNERLRVKKDNKYVSVVILQTCKNVKSREENYRQFATDGLT